MIKIRFHRPVHRLGWEVYVFRYDLRTSQRYEYRITIEESQPKADGTMITEPSAFVPEEEFPLVVAAIKDGLAEAGLLKSSGALELQLQATQFHLEDMRSLVFKTGMRKP